MLQHMLQHMLGPNEFYNICCKCKDVAAYVATYVVNMHIFTTYVAAASYITTYVATYVIPIFFLDRIILQHMLQQAQMQQQKTHNNF